MQSHQWDTQRLVRYPGAKRERVGYDDGISPGRFLLDEAVQRRSAVAYDGREDAKRANLMPERRVGGGLVELLDRSDRHERQLELLEQWREVRVCGDGDDVSPLAKPKSDRHKRMDVTRASDRHDEYPHGDTWNVSARLSLRLARPTRNSSEALPQGDETRNSA